jgi:hypothetical protein
MDQLLEQVRDAVEGQIVRSGVKLARECGLIAAGLRGPASGGDAHHGAARCCRCTFHSPSVRGQELTRTVLRLLDWLHGPGHHPQSLHWPRRLCARLRRRRPPMALL